MIVVLSGTNRPGSNTLKVAKLADAALRDLGRETELLDLHQLPASIFEPGAYAEKPEAFAPFQGALDKAHGLVTVLPEYNGGFPGVLKYFVDMLRFPGSFEQLPCAFVGLSAGMWGALRAIEQLEMVYQYRYAHLFSRRVLLPKINDALDAEGRLSEALDGRLRAMLEEFVAFADRLKTDA